MAQKSSNLVPRIMVYHNIFFQKKLVIYLIPYYGIPILLETIYY